MVRAATSRSAVSSAKRADGIDAGIRSTMARTWEAIEADRSTSTPSSPPTQTASSAAPACASVSGEKPGSGLASPAPVRPASEASFSKRPSRATYAPRALSNDDARSPDTRLTLVWTILTRGQSPARGALRSRREGARSHRGAGRATRSRRGDAADDQHGPRRGQERGEHRGATHPRRKEAEWNHVRRCEQERVLRDRRATTEADGKRSLSRTRVALENHEDC